MGWFKIKTGRNLGPQNYVYLSAPGILRLFFQMLQYYTFALSDYICCATGVFLYYFLCRSHSYSLGSMGTRSYISQLQGSLFCAHAESAFWPSEAMFYSPIHSCQGPFSELFSILSVSILFNQCTFLLQKCQTGGQQFKFDKMNDFINIVFSVIPIIEDSLFRAFIWFAAFFIHKLFM